MAESTKTTKTTKATGVQLPAPTEANPPDHDADDPPDPPNLITEQLLETALATQTEVKEADANQVIGRISNDGLTFFMSEHRLQLPTHFPPELEKLALRFICKMWKVKEIPVK